MVEEKGEKGVTKMEVMLEVLYEGRELKIGATGAVSAIPLKAEMMEM